MMNKKNITKMAKGVLVGYKNSDTLIDNLVSLGEEWSKINHAKVDKKSKKQIKQECRDYLFRNYDRELVSEGVLSSFLLSLVIRLITNWLINILLQRKNLNEQNR